jgi:endonuclease/exonuclease/phosphatase family metal-dependent hydrolase
LQVDILVGSERLHVFNVHLDVFQRAHRKTQIEALVKWVRVQGIKRNVIIGGDFNYQAVLRTYASHQPEDERLPPSFDGLWDLDLEIKEAFIRRWSTPDEIHAEVTFKELCRRPDLLFYSRGLAMTHAEIISKSTVSDHQPVLAEFVLE